MKSAYKKKINDERIAVIGGGFTGLVCAYELAKKGYIVTLIEKGNSLGGLAGGFPINDLLSSTSNNLHFKLLDSNSLNQTSHKKGNKKVKLPSGEEITLESIFLEKTYHHIFKTDTDIINLAKELGVKSRISWYRSSMSIYYGNKLYPFNGALDLLKFSPISLFSRVRLGILTLFLQKYKSWKTLENITALNWMKKFAGKEAVKVIWKPLLVGKFSKEYFNKISMAWLWARIHVRANSREFMKKETLGYFDGGFNVLIKKLEEELIKLGVEIKKGCEIESIKKSNNNTENYSIYLKENQINTRQNDNEESQEFTRIISTVPSSVFCNLFKEELQNKQVYVKKLNSVRYLGAICLIFKSTQKISNTYWHNINDVASPFLVFINHTELVHKRFYGGYYVYYIAGYYPISHEYFAMKDNDLEKLWFDGLKRVFPKFEQSSISQKWLWKFPHAQHVVDIGYKDKIPKHKTPIKKVYLSNFSQIYPEDRGTNFAVREGIKIAELVIKDIYKS